MNLMSLITLWYVFIVNKYWSSSSLEHVTEVGHWTRRPLRKPDSHLPSAPPYSTALSVSLLSNPRDNLWKSTIVGGTSNPPHSTLQYEIIPKLTQNYQNDIEIKFVRY